MLFTCVTINHNSQCLCKYTPTWECSFPVWISAQFILFAQKCEQSPLWLHSRIRLNQPRRPCLASVVRRLLTHLFWLFPPLCMAYKRKLCFQPNLESFLFTFTVGLQHSPSNFLLWVCTRLSLQTLFKETVDKLQSSSSSPLYFSSSRLLLAMNLFYSLSLFNHYMGCLGSKDVLKFPLSLSSICVAIVNWTCSCSVDLDLTLPCKTFYDYVLKLNWVELHSQISLLMFHRNYSKPQASLCFYFVLAYRLLFC